MRRSGPDSVISEGHCITYVAVFCSINENVALRMSPVNHYSFAFQDFESSR